MELHVDTEKLMKLIRRRAALSEMAYPDMTDEQAAELIKRIATDEEFGAMVKQCLVIENVPAADS